MDFINLNTYVKFKEIMKGFWGFGVLGFWGKL